jgi:hypothetical protein
VLAIKGTKSVHSVIPNLREWLIVLSVITATEETIFNFYIFKGMRRREITLQNVSLMKHV